MFIFLYLLLFYCSLKPEDIEREAATPDIVSRPNKAHDRRNMEDNTNFFNSQKNQKLDQKPSEYERGMAITQLINAALTGHTEERMDNLKGIDEKTSEARDAIKKNEEITNPDDIQGKPINLVEWLSNENSEEKELDQELSQEVEIQMNNNELKEEHEVKNKENRFMNARRSKRESQNGFIQSLRKRFNID